ncbi:hypothetical protein ACU4GD_44970 [Cupriavidus basilensis]
MAIGHRVVHGGADFSAAVKIEHDAATGKLEALVPLAPAASGRDNLTAIRAVRAAAPPLLQVASASTPPSIAGHDTLAQLLALRPTNTSSAASDATDSMARPAS